MMTDLINQITESESRINSESAQPTSSGSSVVLTCPSCEYSSTNKHYLRQHLELVHTNDRPFKCPFCNYAGKRSHALKEHLVVHSNERPYQCTQCNATFRKKGHLTNHLRMHSETKSIVECFLCQTHPFKSKDRLYTHLRTVHSRDIGENVFCCNRCNFATTNKASLHVHEMAHYDFRNVVLLKPKIPPSASIVLKCTECGFETEQRKELEIHVLEAHSNSTVLRVPVKEASIPTQGRSLTDEEANSVMPKARDLATALSNSMMLNKCHQCGFVTENYKELILHIVTHKEVIAEKVPIKPDTDDTKTVKSANTEKFALPTDGNDLIAVKTYPDDSKTYICNICDYECESQRTIKAHMWKHSGHKKLQYPTFQNGPLSVYDDTLLAAKNFINKDIDSVRAMFLTQDQNQSLIGYNTLSLKTQELATSSSSKATSPVTPDPDALNNNESGKSTKPFPKVIVQRVNQAESFGLRFSSYSTSSRVPSPVTCKTTASGLVTPASSSLTTSPTSPEKSILNSTPATSTSGKIANAMFLKSAPTPTSCSTSLRQIAPVVIEPGTVTEDNPLTVMTAVCEALNRQAHMNEDSCGAGNNVWSDTEQSAATLLSMLRQGQPVSSQDRGSEECQSEASERSLDVACEEVVVSEQIDSINSDTSVTTGDNSSGNEGANFTKPKSGICSSLLAVIEQLRERHVSEEEKSDTSKPPAKRRRRATKSSNKTEPDELSLEIYPNIERVDHNDEIMYRCKLCHYISTASLMKQHLKLHKAKTAQECSLCEFVAPTKNALQDHMVTHCKAKKYQCKKCYAAFNHSSQLRAHMRIHESGQAYICDKCDYLTSSASQFQEHLQLHSEAFKTFNCIACKLSFSDITELQKHMTNSCNEVRRLYHKTEKKTGSRKSKSPPQALKVDEETELHAPGQQVKSCSIEKESIEATNAGGLSDMNVENLEDKRRDDWIPAVEGTVKCDQCNFLALNIRSLKSHRKRHINDKRYIQQPLEQYKCNLCGYVCHHLPSLKSHMWRHAGETDFSYSFSDILSSGNTPLDKKGKPLITLRCCHCGYETLNKLELDNHMKSHWDIIKKTFDIGKQ